LDIEVLFSTVVTILVLGSIVVAANYADLRRDPRLRQWVLGVLLVLNILLVMWYGLLPLAAGEADVSQAETLGSFALALVFGGMATAFLSEGVRARLAGWSLLRRGPAPAGPPPAAARFPEPQPGEPLFPQMLNYYTTATVREAGSVEDAGAHSAAWDAGARGFDPRSMVHAVALVFCIYLLGTQFITFVLGGGLEGVAEGFAEGLTAWDLILNGLPLVIIPVLGVGLGMRRNFRQALVRLGLRQMTLRELGIAAGMTVALLILVSVVGSTWQLLVPPETFEEQTRASEALAESVTTIWLALVLAASAAISEEIAFRGALQPVFGFWPTAIIFALTHMQYALTPATLIILGVAMAFGWIRVRYSTTVAIVTHFLYNFIPLAANVAIGTEALRWLQSLGLFR